MRDPYVVLGVSRNASQEEIRKAYRSLAMQWHPDRHPGEKEKKEAEVKFKEIAAAYEILDNPQKKENFHRTGQFQDGKPFTSPFDDFFSNFFRTSWSRPVQGENIVVEETISLEDAFHGGERDIRFVRMEICSVCGGKGGTEVVCPHCEGTGAKTIYGKAATVRTPCHACAATGKTIAEPCQSCNGGYTHPNESSIKFKIPRGVEDGMRFSFHGLGQQVPGSAPGNLIVVVRVKPHELFERHLGGNLILKVPVSYSQLVLGAEIQVPSLHGVATFKLPPGTQDRSRFKLKEMGLPIFTNKEVYTFGDQIIEVELEVPTQMDEGYEKLVKELAEHERRNVTPRKAKFDC